MDNQILSKIIEHLRSFKEDKIKEIKANIITENGADEFCDLINYEAENSFTLLFGREHLLENETGENDNGILKNFNYKDDKKCKFAVMLSYWNYVNDNGKEKIDDNRKNSFYKGRRWSDINNRRNFYSYFNILKERLGSENVPVSFLVKMFISNSNYIRIITAGSLDKATEKPIKKEDANHFTLYFPELFKEFTKGNIEHPNLKEFVTLILSYKEEKNNILFDRDNINHENIKNEIDEKLKAVISEFDSIKNSKLKKYIIALMRSLKDVTLKDCNKTDLLKMLLLYQFYDIPYVMHFFLPKEKDNKNKQDYSCLAFSTPIDYSFELDCISNWEEYINIIEGILCLREEIWNNINPDILKITNAWKTSYNENLEKYVRLSNVAKNIFQSICEKASKDTGENIDIYQISLRVKEFDSLFNKLINRANGKDDDFPDPDDPANLNLFNQVTFEEYIHAKKNTPTDKVNINKLREELIRQYRDIVEHPFQINIKKVFNAIKDIVGLRIVCKFQRDVNALHKIFIDSNNEKYGIQKLEKFGLERTSIKEGVVKHSDVPNEMGYYYTSNHYTFKLANERKKLIEFDDLCDITFELQVRTTLSQGISDVSHELFYKPKLPEGLKREFKASIKNNIEKNSWKIKESDDDFSELKRQYIEKRGK